MIRYYNSLMLKKKTLNFKAKIESENFHNIEISIDLIFFEFESFHTQIITN